MVAYSFQPRFIEPIEAGLKTHTLRGFGKRRHARPGEALQLYTGMRTRLCRLIGLAECHRRHGIFLKFSIYQQFSFFDVAEEDGRLRRIGRLRSVGDPDAFARSDGFDDIEDMARFWRDVHRVTNWEGVLIGWRYYRRPH